MKTLNDLFNKKINTDFHIESKKKKLSIYIFNKEVNYITRFFKQLVHYQERVIIYVDDKIKTLELFIATINLGVIPIIINKETSIHNLIEILKDSKPGLIIYDEYIDIFNHFKSINVESLNGESDEVVNVNNIKEDDIATIIYTSGSTGFPKGVVCTHKQIIFCIDKILNRLELKNNDKIGSFLPISFDYGLYQFFFALYKEIPIYLGDKTEINLQFVNLLNKLKISVLPSMPTLTNTLTRLLKRDKCDFLRLITSTGEHFTMTQIKTLKEVQPNIKILPMYGLTECKRVSILKDHELSKKPNSVGKPIDGVTCFVKDEKGALHRTGKGILVIKGPNVMKGYWKNRKNDHTFFSLNNENYLETEDYFFIDDEEYLYFLGREGDLYKQNGFRIYGKEIEAACEFINGIDKCVLLVPYNDQEEAILIVKTKKSVTSIKNDLQNYIELYKIPPVIKQIENFPLTTNGKIDKNKLRGDFY